MAKGKGNVAALPIMQQEADAGNTVDETELAPENPDAPAVDTTQAAPAAEGAAAPTTEKPKPATEDRMVPIARLNEVINERNQLRESWARLDERRQLAQQLESQAQQTAEAARVAATRPDPDVDPQGARIWDLEQKLTQTMQAIPQLQQNFQQTAQTFQQQQAQLQMQQYENMDVQRAVAAHPDYMSALGHLKEVRVGLNMKLGYSREQAEQLWNVETRAYVAQAMQNGTSATEYAYEMAKLTGYQGSQINGNGTAAAQPTNGAPNGAQRITQLQNGQKVQGLGGKIPATESDPNSNIKSMNAQQFAEWMGQYSDEEFLALLNTNAALRTAVNQKFVELG